MKAAVIGYKGEIDLLKKLTEVDRVVRLFDWEMNDEKQELSVLMEKGDTDLDRLLSLRLSGSDVRFDPVFTRYHWREMLECVQAVPRPRHCAFRSQTRQLPPCPGPAETDSTLASQMRSTRTTPSTCTETRTSARRTT